jgi:autotransporter translocation and assembly factor TamB
VIAIVVVAALSAAAVAAVGAAGDTSTTIRGADVVAAEAGHHGLDPALLGALVATEGIDATTGGPQSELRATAKLLRGGIDTHRSVVGALAAVRAGDDRVSGWLRSRPLAASSAGALPDARTGAFVSEVLALRARYASEGSFPP